VNLLKPGRRGPIPTLEPIVAMPVLSRSDAAHLLRRTGFGVTSARLRPLVGLTRAEAVRRVMDFSGNPAATRPAVIGDESLTQYMRAERLGWWWMDRMRTSPAPLQEKMTLFWHGHLVSSQWKLWQIDLLFDQNQLFRGRALGDFRKLVQKVAVDPAMLQYLDNAFNRAGAVQENFGRELMELFTLGRGHYSEKDVVAMSRAWTGHVMDESTRRYRFEPAAHDNGAKTLFGITKNWNGPDALDEILLRSKRDRSSRFIAAKLFSFLAYPLNPGSVIAGDLAKRFRSSGLSIRALVKAILLHDAFWSTKARWALVRTPTEFLVAAMEALNIPSSQAHPEWFADSAGQMLFCAPNVAGWGSNDYWLSSGAMLSKAAFAAHVRWIARDAGLFRDFHKLRSGEAVQRAFAHFGIDEPSEAARRPLEAWHAQVSRSHEAWSIPPNLVQGVLLSPDFQLA
jgi:uncharacterized protein (DUF1800 family)